MTKEELKKIADEALNSGKGKKNILLKQYDQTETVKEMVRLMQEIAPEPFEMDETLPLKNWLHYAREHTGLTIAEAADLFGISKNSYLTLEYRMASTPRIPSYDLRRLPPNAKDIVMDIDEMRNGDLMVHPRAQDVPLHVIHFSDRQFLMQKLIDIAAYYKTIDPDLKLYYSFHDYVLRKEQSEEPLVSPANYDSPCFINIVKKGDEEQLSKALKEQKKLIYRRRQREKKNENDINGSKGKMEEPKL